MAEGKPATLRRRAEASLKTHTVRANARALALAPIIAEIIQVNGATRPHAIAAALTDRGVPTALGCRFWTSTQVRQVLDRIALLTPLSLTSTQSSTSLSPKRAARPLIDVDGIILSNAGGKVTRSQARGRGRPTAREIVGQILTQMRTEGTALHKSHRLLAKTVAARYGRDLGDPSWSEGAIRQHVGKWLRENPDANDYRIALTLKEAARESGVKRSLLDIAISRGTLRAHKCTARTMILQSDLRRFMAKFFGGSD
jgi:hypothetical protein